MFGAVKRGLPTLQPGANAHTRTADVQQRARGRATRVLASTVHVAHGRGAPHPFLFQTRPHREARAKQLRLRRKQALADAAEQPQHLVVKVIQRSTSEVPRVLRLRRHGAAPAQHRACGTYAMVSRDARAL